MKLPRRSGVLIHPTSLPGKYGIGDFGDAAFQFVDFLADSRQTYWQILPISPTGYGDSPYQGLSAFAGNHLLLSLDRIAKIGHLDAKDLTDPPKFPTDCVDFGAVIPFKSRLLSQAFSRYSVSAPQMQKDSFARFCREQQSWLDDYALFMALKEENALEAWYTWQRALKLRNPSALTDARVRLARQIEFQKYLQWQFYEQWNVLKGYAHSKGVRIIGDVPIYVAMDSADVWANPDVFLLNDDLEPIDVAGVPPDYFSETGQLWGNPLYRWDKMKEAGYRWWIERFRTAFIQSDIVRVDHFRGFYNHWAVPAGEDTAVKGEWRLGPGADLFHAVTAALGDMTIIAEDLGEFDTSSRAGVDRLQAEFGYPGMKVVQFAFGDGPTDPFLPHNFSREWVVYTGTHDNDTTVGWYQATSTEKERDYARRYVARDGSDIAWDFVRLAWASVANTAIATAQDLLSLGHASRMNTPSTVGPPNWCWRLEPGKLDNHHTSRLREMTETYGRVA